MEKGRVTSLVFATLLRNRNGRCSNMQFAWTRGAHVGYADVPARALHMWIPHYPVNADQYSTTCENSMTRKNWLQSKTTRGSQVGGRLCLLAMMRARFSNGPEPFRSRKQIKKKNVLNRSIIPSSQSSQFCFVKIALFYNVQNHWKLDRKCKYS